MQRGEALQQRISSSALACAPREPPPPLISPQRDPLAPPRAMVNNGSTHQRGRRKTSCATSWRAICPGGGSVWLLRVARRRYPSGLSARAEVYPGSAPGLTDIGAGVLAGPPCLLARANSGDMPGRPAGAQLSEGLSECCGRGSGFLAMSKGALGCSSEASHCPLTPSFSSGLRVLWFRRSRGFRGILVTPEVSRRIRLSQGVFWGELSTMPTGHRQVRSTYCKKRPDL